ncbi:MAG: hypothetical protein HY323_08225 [Betaproteobacteria bacterium]|nr:hypothetical protein [Betaproteobacteria bacterium]
MNALVIGRGSMGRRRIRDLTALGVEVESWDPIQDHMIPLLAGYDFRVISTPPMTHFKYADTRIACFTEADTVFVESGPQRFPSATPLFCADIVRITASDNPRPIAYALHVGQHIDDWHPGADPATYYAYRDETGPTREMVPFELIWLTRWLGPVVDVCGQRDQYFAQLIVKHASGARGSILIDTLSRPAIRRFTAKGSDWRRSYDISYTEEAYLREMRALVAAVKGEAPWPYSQAEEAANLEVLRTIE